MQSWLGKRVLSYAMGRLRRGNVRPLLLLYHQNVRFSFPGRNSWSGVLHGKRNVEQWLRRLADVGLQNVPDEVVVQGMPWNTTVCVRGHDYLDTAEEGCVYENRYVIWGHMAWGRLRSYEVYEDTHEPESLDAYIRRHRPDLIVT